MKRSSAWPAVVGIIICYIIAAVIEPCDGHSCDAEVTHGGR